MPLGQVAQLLLADRLAVEPHRAAGLLYEPAQGRERITLYQRVGLVAAAGRRRPWRRRA